MIINKNTWHYKFNVCSASDYKTCSHTTLCSYFWFTVGNCMDYVLAAGAVLVVLTLLGIPFSDYVHFTLLPVSGLLTASMLVVVALCIAGTHILVTKLASYVFKRRPVKHEKSLLYNYLKAKKEKMYPLIAFE